MLDVIEHAPDPRSLLRIVHARLSRNGLLVLQVPNFDSLLTRLQGADSSNFCIGHWNHFDTHTLPRLAETAGFETLSVETIISELDLIQRFPLARVAALASELSGQSVAILPDDPEWLHAHGLGYKVLGIFRRKHGGG
jgi:2-polyprenyl-3-methyl-5-hydroxy-6-metoxy-1,4-benzoquinol methylase